MRIVAFFPMRRQSGLASTTFVAKCQTTAVAEQVRQPHFECGDEGVIDFGDGSFRISWGPLSRTTAKRG